MTEHSPSSPIQPAQAALLLAKSQFIWKAALLSLPLDLLLLSLRHKVQSPAGFTGLALVVLLGLAVITTAKPLVLRLVFTFKQLKVNYAKWHNAAVGLFAAGLLCGAVGQILYALAHGESFSRVIAICAAYGIAIWSIFHNLSSEPESVEQSARDEHAEKVKAEAVEKSKHAERGPARLLQTVKKAVSGSGIRRSSKKQRTQCKDPAKPTSRKTPELLSLEEVHYMCIGRVVLARLLSFWAALTMVISHMPPESYALFAAVALVLLLRGQPLLSDYIVNCRGCAQSLLYGSLKQRWCSRCAPPPRFVPVGREWLPAGKKNQSFLDKLLAFGESFARRCDRYAAALKGLKPRRSKVSGPVPHDK